MPIYAYKCESCGHSKDVLQKISDPVLTVCPTCAASTFHKQLTAAGFQLKGSGWYVTDFRGGKKGDSSPVEGSGQGTASTLPAASASEASSGEVPSAPSALPSGSVAPGTSSA